MTNQKQERHTPGPWLLSKTHRSDVRAGDPKTGQKIANTLTFICANKNVSPKRKAECEANARLIAQSPTLLELLEETTLLLIQIADGDKHGSIEQQIADNTAAITKATGEKE